MKIETLQKLKGIYFKSLETKNYNKQTIKNYKASINNFIKYCNKYEIQEANYNNIDSILKSYENYLLYRYATSTKEQYLKAIKVYLKHYNIIKKSETNKLKLSEIIEANYNNTCFSGSDKLRNELIIRLINYYKCNLDRITQININETRTIKDKKIQLLIKLYLATIKQEHKQETLILNKQNNKISKRTLQGILKKIGYTTKQIKESE